MAADPCQLIWTLITLFLVMMDSDPKILFKINKNRPKNQPHNLFSSNYVRIFSSHYSTFVTY